jgi:triphosphatase
VLLESVLAETDFDDKHELQQWTKDKITALLRVMEMTRSMAMRAETYW